LLRRLGQTIFLHEASAATDLPSSYIISIFTGVAKTSSSSRQQPSVALLSGLSEDLRLSCEQVVISSLFSKPKGGHGILRRRRMLNHSKPTVSIYKACSE
jgi:hypothetical protein